MSRTRIEHISGLILIEAIVSLAFTGFLIMGLTLLFTSGHNAYLRSRNYTQALYLAETKIDEIPYSPAAVLSSSSSNIELVNEVPYHWERTFQPVDNNSTLRQIEVVVRWKEPDGQHQTKLLSQEMMKP